GVEPLFHEGKVPVWRVTGDLKAQCGAANVPLREVPNTPGAWGGPWGAGRRTTRNGPSRPRPWQAVAVGRNGRGSGDGARIAGRCGRRRGGVRGTSRVREVRDGHARIVTATRALSHPPRRSAPSPAA